MDHDQPQSETVDLEPIRVTIAETALGYVCLLQGPKLDNRTCFPGPALHSHSKLEVVANVDVLRGTENQHGDISRNSID